ncbi:hypothetical protein ACF0H5_002034 [Mactra antiquata]
MTKFSELSILEKSDVGSVINTATRSADKMRPPRGESPKQMSQSLRQRCIDRNADEIIRFVRDIQFERPTVMHLRRKAPLPGIGQNCSSSHGTGDSGFLDRATDSMDSDDDTDDGLEDEILYTTQEIRSQKIDTAFLEILTCPRGVDKTCNDYAILSRSLPQGHLDLCNNNTKGKRQNSFVQTSKKQRNGNTGIRKSVAKKLPPMSREAMHFRPSAPSPNRTPPMSDYSIEEETVDYLDLS